MKKLLLVLLIGFGIYAYVEKSPDFHLSPTAGKAAGGQSIKLAYEQRQSDIQVGGSGKVIRILPDDNEGSRHQKFIIRESSGQTILITHNIDLASRINSISKGDMVAFYGEYEWNEKGGVVHWTHHDPNGRHEDGWLKHKGRIYQ